MRRLTEKQQRFVEAYTGSSQGNATDAARRAGYAHPKTQGPRLLENVGVQQAIAEATKEVRQAAIMDREERQRWLTSVARGEECRGLVIGMEGPIQGPDGGYLDQPAPARDRVRAVELLGKMQGDFIERLDVKVEDLLEERLDELEKLLPPEAFQVVLKVIEDEGG